MIQRLFKRQEKKAMTTREVIANYLRMKTFGETIKGAMLFFALTTTIFVVGFDDSKLPSNGSQIGVVRINGAIGGENALGNGSVIFTAMHNAYENKDTKAILIRANSGGGSPVHGEMIYEAINEIKALRESDNRDIPIIAMVEDMCASACYYGIAAADEIIVHKNSIIGSIGVRMEGYEIEDALARVGIKRRLLTAGENKAMLDPYSSWTEQDKAKVTDRLMTPLHDNFKEDVIAARGERLDLSPEVFSGMIYTGNDSVERGLSDRVLSLAKLDKELADRYPDSQAVFYNKEQFSLSRFLSASISDGMTQAVANMQQSGMSVPQF